MEIGEGPAGEAVAAEERVSLIKLKQSVRRAAGETGGQLGQMMEGLECLKLHKVASE